jgi:uncharacterized lipoprotein YmbA
MERERAMKNRACIVKVGWAFILFVFLLTGCSGSPAVKYYTLNTLPDMQQDNTGAASGDDIAIGLGPVEFPKFLDRPQIVTRKGQNQVEVSEFHRWAGSFPEDFSRVLAKDIATLLPSNRVEVYPWEDTFSPTYQVKLKVEQFDGQLGNRVLLNVTWSVVDQEDEVVVRNSLIKEPVSSEDYDGLVEAKSQALGTLSQAIVDEIRRLR